MITNEQREARKQMIGSSDVPRIMAGDGVRVALEKLGELAPDNLDNVPEVQLGNLVEARILDAYESQQDSTLIRSPDTMRHHAHPWLGAHLDAMVAGVEVVECKSVGRYNRGEFGEPGTDEVPDRILWQVQEQLAVAQLPIAKVPVCFITEAALLAFITGRPLPIEIYVIPADRDLEAYIVERCGKVWQHVEARTLPDPEKPMDARLIYRKDTGEIIEADDAAVKLHADLMACKTKVKVEQEREKLLAGKLQAFMKEASELRHNGETLCTWKLNKGRKGFSVAPLDPFRVFLTKEIA